MGSLLDIGPDGEIIDDDGLIHIPFPVDPDLDFVDPLD
jgi:hypothetical protein